MSCDYFVYTVYFNIFSSLPLSKYICTQVKWMMMLRCCILLHLVIIIFYFFLYFWRIKKSPTTSNILKTTNKTLWRGDNTISYDNFLIIRLDWNNQFLYNVFQTFMIQEYNIIISILVWIKRYQIGFPKVIYLNTLGMI